ncbi:MAG TPA: TonB-dependent receptor [Chitinophagaceae bacterium]|nr:TonB-dependent receptor [Chitinophagaceae bacterium]
MKTLLSCLMLCWFIESAAQQSARITGVVADEKNKPIEHASVMLLHAKDSSLVKGGVTNASGVFEFERVATGSYMLQFSKVGYKNTYSEIVTVTETGNAINIGTLVLKNEARSLAEIVVSARKPFIEYKLDRMIVNIENSIISTGNNGLEVLEKLPGVTVQPNGAISLKGQAVQIHIDGRPLNMSADELANFLRSLQASQIERVEIIANPSSRYDAAGSGGIINIRMKKDQKTGFNGTTTLGLNYGKYAKWNGGIAGNYRNKKMNFYGNYTANRRKNFTDIESDRVFRNAGNILARFVQEGTTIDYNTSHNLRLGLDLFLSKNSTLGFLVNGIHTRLRPVTHSQTFMLGSNGAVDSMLFTSINNTSKWNIYTGNVNFKTTLDTTGKELTLDLEHSKYDRSNIQFFENLPATAAGVPKRPTDTLTGDLPAILELTSFKADYRHPLPDNAAFEAGFKSSRVVNDNDLVFYNHQGNGPVLNTSLSNHFIYRENIYALYLSYSRERAKWNYQFGLRGEQTHTEGEQRTTGQKLVPQNYFQLFPSVFINFTPSEKHQLGISYSRRIGRPSYGIVNPFKVFRDPYTYSEGNPFIKPQLSNKISFNYVLNNKFIFGLGYGNTASSMTFVVRQDDATKTTVETFDNLAKLEDASFTVSANIRIAPWWNSNNFFGVFYNHFSGVFGNQVVDNSGFIVNASINHTISLPKNYIIEFGGFYLSKQPQGIITIAPQGNLNIGVQKPFFQKRGIARLTFSDVFRTQQFKKDTRFANIDASFKNTFDSRQVRLSISWKFGKQTVPAERRRRSASEEEKSRIQIE